MNPDTNRFEALKEVIDHNKILDTKLLRPDGSVIPKHWAVFCIGELVVIKNYTFKVVYMNDGTIIFEPVQPQDILNIELLKQTK